MSNVRGFVWIDVRVFDDCFRGIRRRANRLAAYRGSGVAKERATIEISIQIAATGDLDALDAADLADLRRDFLRNLPRRAFQTLRQFETHRRSDFAHLDFRRPLGDDAELDAVFRADECRESVANPFFYRLIHEFSFRKKGKRL